MMARGQDGWCILRTSGQSTLPLAESLRSVGVAAWSPSFRRQKAGAKRKIEIPITPTYVFAGANHLEDVFAIMGDPAIRHPRFSVLRHSGTIPIVDDRELGPLRDEAEREEAMQRAIAEALRRKDEKPPVFQPGQMVTVLDRNFGRETGIVERTKGKFVVVLFPNSLPMDISAFLLQPAEVMAA